MTDRHRIADALATTDGWKWAPGYDKTQSPTYQHYLRQADAVLAVLPETAARAAGWLDAAAECNKAGGAHAGRGDTSAAIAAFALMEKFLMEAGKAAYVATPCSAPDYCEDGGEPCSVHERLMGHVEGDHELCAPDCGDEWARRLAAASSQHSTQADAVSTAEKAASLGMTPDAYRAHCNTAAAQAIRAAARHLYAGVGIRVLAALDEERPTTTTTPDVVAYRNPDRPDVLLCRTHGDPWWGLIPVTSEDLPDGGTCTWGMPFEDDVCGADVLITPAVVSQPDTEV